jgi:hypothetical protein
LTIYRLDLKDALGASDLDDAVRVPDYLEFCVVNGHLGLEQYPGCAQVTLEAFVNSVAIVENSENPGLELFAVISLKIESEKILR